VSVFIELSFLAIRLLHRLPCPGSLREDARGNRERSDARGELRSPFAYDPRVLEPSVFKAYDVRGIYPTQLDEDGAYAVGRAYVEEFKPRRIAVGRDMRLAAPAMARALIEGAADGGAEVADLGMIGTEMLYFAVAELGLDGGICVTASHNPKEYTGMKIVRRGALPVGGDSGLAEIRERALRGFVERDRRGAVGDENIWPAYRERVLSFIDGRALRPLRVVIDAANGMAGAMLPPVLDELPIAAVRCFFDPDGSFPNHEPNPLLPENREFIVAKTLEERADIGVAFDGDADRCFFVDDKIGRVPGDFITALLAEAVLEKEAGAKIIYDVRASWAVPETIERAGGVALVNRVGHAFIKHRMRKEDAAFGGEVSGHYYFRDFAQADSGVVPFLLMLELISRRGKKLSEILAPLRERYFITGELNTPVPDVELKLRQLEQRYAAEGTISHLDGVSVDAPDWHMNVRPSNTEPLLRLNLEARTEELMERKRDEVLALIRS
jgi:phosphomannomutase